MGLSYKLFPNEGQFFRNVAVNTRKKENLGAIFL